MNKTITAFFNDFDDAADAVRRLESAGIPHSDISLVANNKEDRYTQYTNGRTHGHDGHHGDTHADDGAGTGATLGTVVGGGAGLLAGLGMLAIPGLGPVVAAGWLVSTLVGAGAGAAVGGLAGSLIGAGVSEEDAHAYAEGVNRGGALVTVRATEDHVDRIIDILDDEGTVDVDKQQESWRSEGWTNQGIGAAGSTTTGLHTSRNTGMALGMNDSSSGSAMGSGMGSGGTGMGSDMSRGSMSDGREEVIPVAEEELHVGKREVNRGRVRIHSHVVERPVQEQVSLRQEHVEVERRPVSGSAHTGAMGAGDLFRERTVEMEERSEEAVVSKEARVREELVIHKDVDQRTETISDTVRSTEVEVEDERGNRITGTTDRDRR
ncbi:MAG TPA: YsnF/AvaK domain-containing protein [Microvirga sp.]|jgi:uncharacterized protein (TIGR02271 family)